MGKLADMIRSERARKKITQRELGTAIGVGATTVNSYECSKITPTAGKLVKLADFFGCTVDWLLGRTNVRK